MRIERLVMMANDIGNFFATRRDPEAKTAGIVDHMQRFWDPRMRRQIIEHLEKSDGEGLTPVVREAVQKLAALQRDDAA